MMEFLRQWLLRVVSCALLLSAAQQLTPGGALRQIVRFTGGLLLLLAVLQPVLSLDLEDVSPAFSDYEQAMARQEERYARSYEQTFSARIAERTGAYIEDKAESLGLTVRAQVEVESVDGVPLPVGVTLDAAENAALAQYIAGELGIPYEKQRWEAGS